MTDHDLVRLVRSLPEETPSLAWRSALNERVRAESRARRQRRRWAFWSGGLATAAASAAFALVFVVPLAAPRGGDGRSAGWSVDSPVSSTPDAGANPLVAIHAEGAALADLSATGATAIEADLSPGEADEAVLSGML